MLEAQVKIGQSYRLKGYDDPRTVFKVKSKHDGQAYGHTMHFLAGQWRQGEYGYFPYSDLSRAGANNDVQTDDDGAAQSSEGSVDGAGGDSPTGLL